MTAGPSGRVENSVSPFVKLSTDQLFKEVFERGLINDVEGKPIKKNLEATLKHEMKGISRPPALCCGDVNESLDELNLGRYEVSQVEPLHDLKGHIKNLWEILPEHVPVETNKVMKNEIEVALGENKDTYRGCDYRLSVIVVYQRLKGLIPQEIEELLYTLKGIGRLAYQNSEERSPKSILRLYNMTFLHALRCIQVFGEKPKFAKIYGSYFHSIVKHLPEHARIISPSSLYTESEERIFNALRGIGRDATPVTIIC